MANFFILRGRSVPRGDVALVEPFDHETRSVFRPRFDVHGRVILLNRDSILVEEHPIIFSRDNGFLWLSADRVGLNPAITFNLEDFVAKDGFIPRRAYTSRVSWLDDDGNEQSKLLVTESSILTDKLVQSSD